MTRLFLAAGVAALAIASAADAKPGGNGGGHGNGGGQQAQRGGGGGGGHGGGGGGQFQGFRGGGGGGHGGGGFQQAFRGGGGGFQQAFRGGGGGHGHGGGFSAPQMQRFAMPRQHGGGGQRFAFQGQRQEFRMQRQNHGFERQQFRMQAQNHGFNRQQFRMQRQAQNRGFNRQQMRVQQAQNRGFERQQMRMQRQAQNRGFERQQMRMQAQNRAFERQQFNGRNFREAQNGFNREQFRADRMQQRQQLQAFANQRFDTRAFEGRERFNDNAKDFFRNQQFAYRQALNGTSFAPLYYGAGATILAPTIVDRFVGVPVDYVTPYASLSPFPASLDYLYPSGPDYYYRYGDGYAYQIDRGSNLINALIPLLAGGYMPGQYLPQPYMASYVPDYYGFNSFYPDYGDTCNRYANGVVYEVDCYTGLVEDVIPLYASGYGVGQILPSSYAYYNVPYQYRSLYYDTPDYNYWYAPGAIYQYEPRTSMITSVAALLSPGFTVGQPLPVGYDVYNVPYDYRATYYDTPNAWYRYNNGYIYQVDPTTRLVSAIVASILT
jgi:hypothetical protein